MKLTLFLPNEFVTAKSRNIKKMLLISYPWSNKRFFKKPVKPTEVRVIFL